MSNAASKVRILYLEADNADAESVGALVGIVREVQKGGGALPSVNELATATAGALLAETDPAPAALPAKTKRVYKPRAPKAAPVDGATRKRVQGAGDQVIAFVRSSKGRPDWAKVAQAIYGDATKTTKVRQLARQLVATGKLKDGAAGILEVV